MADGPYLIRLDGGPAAGDYTVEMPWPLPETLVYFPATGALVDAAATDKDTGERIVWPVADLHLSIYGKVGESQLPDAVDSSPRLMRGASYRLVPA